MANKGEGWHSHPALSPFPNNGGGFVGSSGSSAWGIREESSIHRSSDWSGVEKSGFVLRGLSQHQARNNPNTRRGGFPAEGEGVMSPPGRNTSLITRLVSPVSQPVNQTPAPPASPLEAEPRHRFSASRRRANGLQVEAPDDCGWVAVTKVHSGGFGTKIPTPAPHTHPPLSCHILMGKTP